MLALDSPSQSKSRPAEVGLPTVCQLVHGLPVGGAEVLVCRIIRQLRHRYRFVVACLDQVGELGEALAAEGVEIICVQRRSGFDWNCVQRLRAFCSRQNATVIHAHQYTPFAYAIATRIYGRRPPVLFTEHGRFYPDYPSLKRKIFNRFMSDKRDQFVAVGNSVRQALVRNEGLRNNRIDVIYNGVDFEEPCGEADSRSKVRKELGYDDDFVVAMVARFDTIKDHTTAIRAIVIAIQQNPRLQLLLIGDGPQRESIEKQVVEHRLENNIRMLGSRSDVARLLGAADVLLLTSVSEGIPMTIIEAMRARVPVVATAVGGVPEIIQHRMTGMLAEAKDAAGIAAAIVELARDDELRRSLTEAAFSRAKIQFSEKSMIRQYDEILSDMSRNSR